MTDADDAPTPIEEWRAIPTFPNYEVSSVGRVRRSVTRWQFKAGDVLQLPMLGPVNHKRKVARLYRDGRVWGVPVSRLIAMAWHGPPPTSTHEAAHNDGQPENNTPGNIRWATPAENGADKVRHGRSLVGERNTRAVLKDSDVRIIRRHRADGISLTAIGKLYGVSRVSIANLIRGKTWRHVK